jgi:hypothetical protein
MRSICIDCNSYPDGAPTSTSVSSILDYWTQQNRARSRGRFNAQLLPDDVPDQQKPPARPAALEKTDLMSPERRRRLAGRESSH